MMFAAADVDPIFMFVLALTGFILGAIVVFQSRFTQILGFGLMAICGAGILAWWP